MTPGRRRARAIRAVMLGVLTAALGVAGGAGCSFPFDEVSTVHDLRVLGIQGEPPEVLIDLPADADFRDPAVQQILYLQIASTPVTLDPLVVDPLGGGAPLAYEVVACPNSGGSATVDEGPGGARGTVGTGPCSADAPASLPVASGKAPPDQMAVSFVPTASFAAAVVTADPLGALFGWPIRVQFRFTNGPETVIAVKRILYTPRIPDDPAASEPRKPHAPNRNPVIPSVTAYLERGDAKEPLAPDVPRAVPLGSSVFIEPGLAEAEEYLTVVLDRDTNLPTVKTIPKEALRYAFYATAGTFSPPSTSDEKRPVFEKSDVLHLESKYRAPDTMPPDPLVTVWILVRDERGGSSHVVRTLVLLEP